MLAEARTIQDKIDALHEELHKKIEKLHMDSDQKRNSIYAKRKETIAKLISEHKLPENFWAQALVKSLKKETNSDGETAGANDTTEFLGPYDVELILNHLSDIDVLYKPTGLRITFSFTPNNFFKEKELWAECRAITHEANDLISNEKNDDDHDTTNAIRKEKELETSEAEKETGERNNKIDYNSKEQDNDDNDEYDDIDEDDERDRRWVFSGITWNDGYGPSLSEDDEQTGEEINSINTNSEENKYHKRNDREEQEQSSKRARVEEKQFDANHNTSDKMTTEETTTTTFTTTTTNENNSMENNKIVSARRGPTVLDVFSVMPPYPTHDDELLEKDEEGEIDEQLLFAAIEAWNDEMDDREALLLDVIANQLYANPVRYFQTEFMVTSTNGAAEEESFNQR